MDAFCEDKLDQEYKTLCNKLVKKLGRKHDVPFKRGKLENWASGIVYAIGQINYLFDKNFDHTPHPMISANISKPKNPQHQIKPETYARCST